MKDKFYPKLFQAVLENGQAYRKDEKSAEYKVIKRTLNWMLREYQGPYKLYASKEAIALADERKLEKDLTEYSWRDQVKTGKGGMGDVGRRKFHREHIYPIAQIIKDLMIVNPKNIEEIEIVLDKISIAWITKDQREKLDRVCKSERGDNPLERCEIELGEDFGEYVIKTKDSAFEDEKDV